MALWPPQDGFLPYFLAYSSLAAIIHSLVCYISPTTASMKQFSGLGAPSKPDKLLAHVYGVKNFYTALIRGYALYNLDNRAVYDLAAFTYVGVLFLYVTEMAIWKTVRCREGWFPLVTAGVGLGWMVLQREFYVVS